MIERRCFLTGCCSCAALAALAGCTSLSAPEGRVEPGYKPMQASDEGGLWQMVEKSEAELKASRALIRDPELNAYVKDVASRITGDYAPDLRVYILRTPQFNASMAPNGMMQVWTGLLLRVGNEAQLAAVLGHEMGHYLERHSLQRWRDQRWKTDLMAFASIGLSAIGYGQFNDLVNLASLASIMSFSREQERRADEIGFDLMVKAGYRPVEASNVWERLVAEQKAKVEEKSEPVSFFRSHPDSEERMKTLRDRAAHAPDSGEVFLERYREHRRPVRTMLLQDELRLRQYGRTLVVLKALTETDGEDGELAFYTGEVYRLRDDAGDQERARDAYERALARADGPPEVYRSLGLLHRHAGDWDTAEIAFRRYLELRPDAADAAMIRGWLRT